MEINDDVAVLKKTTSLHDEALFGRWVSASEREHGVVEKTGTILKRLPRMERMIWVILILMIFPILSAIGLPTQELAPIVLKFVLHLLGA